MQLDRPASDALPTPDAASEAHSREVAGFLHRQIDDAGGSISFGEFMQQALYAPGLGYYAAGARKFGAAGDFVTAPEVSPLFGRVLARQCAPLFRDDPRRELLELGPGSGALMVQLLESLAALDALPARYLILEVSPDLQQRQQQRLQAELPQLVSRVAWLDRLPTGFCGAVVANEVADALPVERFVRGADGVDQLRVVSCGGGFDFERVPAPEWLAAAVADIESSLGRRLPPDYVSELSPGLDGWIGEIADSLQQALVYLFDYGVARHEYYAADRSDGWLRCHFRHRVHNDPLRYPGIQDLTAWVDFTGVAKAAVAHDLQVAGYLTQSRFLLDGGLADELAAVDPGDAASHLELSRQVKLLTLPGEMGEHFKCLGLMRGEIDVPPVFSRGDRAHVL